MGAMLAAIVGGVLEELVGEGVRATGGKGDGKGGGERGGGRGGGEYMRVTMPFTIPVAVVVP